MWFAIECPPFSNKNKEEKNSLSHPQNFYGKKDIFQFYFPHRLKALTNSEVPTQTMAQTNEPLYFNIAEEKPMSWKQYVDTC